MPIPSALDRDQFAALVERLPVGIAVYCLEELDDPASLRLVYGNAQSEAITGLRLEEEIGRTIGEITPNVFETGLAQVYADVARSGEGRDLGEIEYGDERIERRTFEIRAFPLHPQCVAIEFEDISERTELRELRRVQDALRHSEERLRMATDSASIGTWDYDLLADRLEWDTRCKAVFGLPPDAPISYERFLAGIHPDDRARTHETVQDAIGLNGRGEYDIEYRAVLPTGAVRWIHATGQTLFQGDGEGREATRFIGTVRDITAAKEAEEALRTSEERYRFLGQTLEQQLWTSLPDGRLDYVNRFTCEYFGRTEAEMIGEGWQDVVHPDDLGGVVAKWTAALQTGEPYEVEFRLRRASDGQYRWHLGRAHALRDEADEIVKWFGANTDIHERNEVQEALEQARQELEVRVQDRTAHLQAYAEDLKLLHRITTAEHPSREALIEAYLKAGCAMFDVPIGVLGVFGDGPEGKTYTPEAIIGDTPFLKAGTPVPLDRLFVDAVFRDETTVIVEDAADDPVWQQHPAHTERHYRAFLGIPLWVGGELYGAVEFLSREPKDGGFAAFEHQLAEVLAEMIGRTLSLEQAEEARAAHDRLYRSIVDTVSEALLLVDRDGTILMSNPSAHRLLGIDTDQRFRRLVGESRRDVFDEAGRIIADEDLPERTVLRTGESVFGAIQGVRQPDGTTAWFSVNARALDRDDDGTSDAVVVSFSDITRLRNARQALEEQTILLQEAQHLARLGSWYFDIAADHVHWSDELYAIFGVDSQTEVTYATYAERLHPEDRADVEAVVGAAMQTGEPYELNHRIVRPDGTIRWIHSHGEVFVGDDGAPLRLQGTAQDVTERVEAQRAIEALTRRLERILEAAGEGIYGLDLQGRTTFLNAAAAEMLGYSREELIGVRQHEVLHHSHADGSPYPLEDCPIYAVLHDGRERRVADEVFWRKDGTGFPVEYVSTAIEENGRVVGAVVVFQDVTERKKAEEAVRASEMRLRSLTDAAVEAIITADHHGRIVDWNQGAESIFGYDREDVLGEPLQMIMPERYREAHRAGLERYLRTGEAHVLGQSVELDGLRRDGTEFPIDLSLTTWTMEGAPFFTGIVRDITERREAQEQLEQYAAELEAAQRRLESYTDELEERNEELQQFAYVASHDLQEPLRMVTSFLQLLERRYADALDETAVKYIDFAVDGARRMQALIQDLLAYSRVGTHGKGFEAVDTNDLLVTVLRDLGPALDDVSGVVETDTLPEVAGDPTQLHQLFQNLIGNAIKFRRPGVPPRIRIRAGAARLASGKPGWRFTVADNGIGIDQQYADRIFQVFQRLHTRDEYDGTGIGLAICKKIVERHGGEIGFEPTPGGGTTFYFTLPGGSPLLHPPT